jgi:hypothetical protein
MCMENGCHSEPVGTCIVGVGAWDKQPLSCSCMSSDDLRISAEILPSDRSKLASHINLELQELEQRHQ